MTVMCNTHGCNATITKIFSNVKLGVVRYNEVYKRTERTRGFTFWVMNGVDEGDKFECLKDFRSEMKFKKLIRIKFFVSWFKKMYLLTENTGNECFLTFCFRWMASRVKYSTQWLWYFYFDLCSCFTCL